MKRTPKAGSKMQPVANKMIDTSQTNKQVTDKKKRKPGIGGYGRKT